MKLRIVSTLVVSFALAALSFPSLAGSPDFSICGDFTGPERGLCQAAVAIGCDSDNSSYACAQIAEQFENATGEAPPYVVVSISPTSGYSRTCYRITDLQDRFISSDTVWFHSRGQDPTLGQGTQSPAFSVSANFFVGPVPDIAPGSYLVSVLHGATLKLGPVNFEILRAKSGEQIPPACAP